MKRDEKPLPSLHRTNEIDTSDDTFVLDKEDIAALEDVVSDAQHLRENVSIIKTYDR